MFYGKLRKWLLGFDLFRKSKEDLERPTFLGAIFSLASLIFIVCLVYYEYFYVLVPTTQKHFAVSTSMMNSSSKYKMNLDILFTNAPCASLTLTTIGTTRDIEPITSYSGDVIFERINNTGYDIIPDSYIDPLIQSGYSSESNEVLAILTGIRGREMCRISGTILADKMPGAVIISHRKKLEHLERIKENNKEAYEKINLSHTFLELSFGDRELQDSLTRKHGKKPETEFDKMGKLRSPQLRTVACHYYLKVMPHIFESESSIEIYQYSSHQSCYVFFLSSKSLFLGCGD